MFRLHGKSLRSQERHWLCEANPISFDLPPGAAAPGNIDVVREPALSTALAERISGTPASGTISPGTISSTDVSPAKVIWVDSGDECLVHLDSLRAKVLDRMLLVSADFETDQTGRAALVVALALGGDGDPAGLVAVTNDLPRGNGLLAGRWGHIFQEAVWAALLGMAQDFAGIHKGIPMGISAVPGVLKFTTGGGIAPGQGVRA